MQRVTIISYAFLLSCGWKYIFTFFFFSFFFAPSLFSLLSWKMRCRPTLLRKKNILNIWAILNERYRQKNKMAWNDCDCNHGPRWMWTAAYALDLNRIWTNACRLSFFFVVQPRVYIIAKSIGKYLQTINKKRRALARITIEWNIPQTQERK